MKYNVKKLIATFMAATLIVSGSANYMLVGAEGLPNTGGVPYDETKAQFILDANDTEHPVPEVTMGIAVGEDVPPGPPTPGEYDLQLDWGALKLTYTFNTDAEGNVTGGSWGETFDGTNNQIKATNNSTTQEITCHVIYTNVSSVESPALYDYAGGVLLADYVEGSYIPCNGNKGTGELAKSGEVGNTYSCYIYAEDVYDTIIADNPSFEFPTTHIDYGKIGVITVEAWYKM